MLADCAIGFWDWGAASKAHYNNVPEHFSCHWHKYSEWELRTIYKFLICHSLFHQLLMQVCYTLQVKLPSCQRIVLLNYNKETKLIDLRHYSIRLQPVGVSRRIRKFVQNHQVPDLRSLQDVSDFVTKYVSLSLLMLIWIFYCTSWDNLPLLICLVYDFFLFIARWIKPSSTHIQLRTWFRLSIAICVYYLYGIVLSRTEIADYCGKSNVTSSLLP